MKEYNIEHNWKHWQGHTVIDVLNKFPISAESEEEAILNFAEINENLGKYINKDEDGDFIYGNVRFERKWDGDKKNNQIKAIEVL